MNDLFAGIDRAGEFWVAVTLEGEETDVELDENFETLCALETGSGVDLEWKPLAEDLQDEDAKVGMDDLLDAMVLVATAQPADDETLHRLPDLDGDENGDVPTDGEGRPMQMVYRAEEPFEI